MAYSYKQNINSTKQLSCGILWVEVNASGEIEN